MHFSFSSYRMTITDSHVVSLGGSQESSVFPQALVLFLAMTAKLRVIAPIGDPSPSLINLEKDLVPRP